MALLRHKINVAVAFILNFSRLDYKLTVRHTHSMSKR